jgi:hypothetical protein
MISNAPNVKLKNKRNTLAIKQNEIIKIKYQNGN